MFFSLGILRQDLLWKQDVWKGFPFFCAFPTWECLKEFTLGLPNISFALFFLSVSAYLFQRTVVDPIINYEFKILSRSTIFGIIGQSLLVAAALGVYQVNIFTFI